MVRLPILGFIGLLVVLYCNFIWQTQVWSGFNPSFVERVPTSRSARFAAREIRAADNSHGVGGKDLPALGHRRCRGRSDGLQRQPECLDLLHAPLSSRLLRHRLGSHAVPRQQGVVSAWREPGGSSHLGRTRRHAWPRAGHVRDQQRSAKRARQSAVRRVQLVFRT